MFRVQLIGRWSAYSSVDAARWRYAAVLCCRHNVRWFQRFWAQPSMTSCGPPTKRVGASSLEGGSSCSIVNSLKARPFDREAGEGATWCKSREMSREFGYRNRTVELTRFYRRCRYCLRGRLSRHQGNLREDIVQKFNSRISS